MGDTSSAGLRVLLLEDEALVAMLLEDFLCDLGHSVVHVASSVAPALDYVHKHGDAFDIALLDVNVDGQPSFAVAEALASKRKTFVFSTGYGANGMPEAWRDRPVLSKPFGAAEVARVFGHAMQATEQEAGAAF